MTLFPSPWLLVKVVIEIAILAVVIYEVLYYLRNTRGSLVLFGFFIFWMSLKLLTDYLDLQVISYLLTIFGNSLLLVLFVIFQPEIRRALAQVGSYFVKRNALRQEVIAELVMASRHLSGRKCGALIVLERKMRLQNLIEDSVKLDIKVNALVLESIFFPNSPLHDGAVLIRNDRILAARAILPLTRAKNISECMGTRHRAALGITEESDAVALVVSEETGSVSIACRGEFHRDLDEKARERLLDKLINANDESEVSEALQIIEDESSQSASSGEGGRHD